MNKFYNHSLGRLGRPAVIVSTMAIIAIISTGVAWVVMPHSDSTSNSQVKEGKGIAQAPNQSTIAQSTGPQISSDQKSVGATQPDQNNNPGAQSSQAATETTQPPHTTSSTQQSYGQTSIAPANQVVDGLTSDQWTKLPPADCHGFVNSDPGSTRYSKLPLTLSTYDVNLKGSTPVTLTASSPHGLVIDTVWSNNECHVPVGIWYDGAIVSGLSQQVMISASSTATPGDYVLTVQAQAHLIRYVANITVHYTN